MSGISLGIIAPHPPIIVPPIGSEYDLKQVEKTISALKKVNKDIKQINPEILITISPHSPVYRDAYAIRVQNILMGSLSNFGYKQISIQMKNDAAFIESLIENMNKNSIKAIKIDENEDFIYGQNELDHGVIVPLYYLTNEDKYNLISLSISFLNYQNHYKFGKVINDTVKETGKDAVFIASGDLSHRLKPGAPAGFHPDGEKFDKKIVEIINSSRFDELFQLDDKLIYNAGECGLRSIFVLAGCFDGKDVESKVLSYEGPFGVGYMVAEIIPIQ